MLLCFKMLKSVLAKIFFKTYSGIAMNIKHRISGPNVSHSKTHVVGHCHNINKVTMHSFTRKCKAMITDYTVEFLRPLVTGLTENSIMLV